MMDPTGNLHKKGLQWYMSNLGPSAILSMAVMGAGTMSVLATVGSGWGYTYFWAVIMSVVFAWFSMYVTVKVTCKSGLTPNEALEKFFNSKVAWTLIILTFFCQTFVVISQGRGLITACTTLQQAITGSQPGKAMEYVYALLGVAIVCFLFLGFTSQDTRVLTAIINCVILFMLFCFVACLFVIDIDWNALFKGLIPSLKAPERSLLPSDRIVPTIGGIMGGATGLYTWMYHGFALKMHGWNSEEYYEAANWDNFFYTGIMFGLFSVSVFIISAAVLHPLPEATTTVGGAAVTLTPLLGKWATYVFCLGWIGAVITTMAGAVLNGFTALCYKLGMEVSLKNKAYRYMMAGLCLIYAGVIAPSMNVGALSLLTRVASSVTMMAPPAILAFWIMTSKKENLGVGNKLWEHVMFALLLAVSLYCASRSVGVVFAPFS